MDRVLARGCKLCYIPTLAKEFLEWKGISREVLVQLRQAGSLEWVAFDPHTSSF